ncbi:hypothetical protein EYC84_009102 [Monilinia fructicola]|uniref:Uncharacterized protein n=1 Tax=Monilinia fructicola TaxID=38448 RepID=A0A5M9JFG0_MONFR|nr:hypothetical protein EYC84_009102 [Monilinia fructicola]
MRNPSHLISSPLILQSNFPYPVISSVQNAAQSKRHYGISAVRHIPLQKKKQKKSAQFHACSTYTGKQKTKVQLCHHHHKYYQEQIARAKPKLQPTMLPVNKKKKIST